MKRARGILITGTDTGVGKTWVTCQILEQLRSAGMNALGMKPVASGMTQIDGQWVNQDVEMIMQATGSQADRALVNPYAFKPFVAPHLAAEAADIYIDMEIIVDCYQELAGQADYVVVEGAGGLMTPLNHQDSFIELATRLQLTVVLVVAIRLGCINHALLTAGALDAAGVTLSGWIANYPEEVGKRDIGIETAIKTRLSAPQMGVILYNSRDLDKAEIDLSQIVDQGL